MKKRVKEKAEAAEPAKRGIVYKLLMLVCLVVFLFSLYKVADILINYQKIDNFYDKTKEEFANEDGQLPDVDFEKLLSINKDVVGWIYIEDTDIDYPILHGKDNSFYLTHTYEKEWLLAGSIFMEATNSSDFNDDHTVIFGHNMHNGAMFGGLDKFFEEDYLKEHKYVYVLLPGDIQRKYEIVSVYTAEVEDGTFTVFNENEESYQKYNDLINSKNIYTDMKTENDGRQIITLSTCTEDSNYALRNVLQAKLVEEKKADGKQDTDKKE